jgi:hypothetical protein
METCRFCGARLFDGAGHCTRCFSPVVPSEDEIQTALVEVAAASGNWKPPPKPMDPWVADDRHTRERAPTIHSRYRAGVLSFSLPAKIALMVLVVAGIPFLAWAIAGALAVGPILIWSITATPRALRDLWKRTRIT